MTLAASVGVILGPALLVAAGTVAAVGLVVGGVALVAAGISDAAEGVQNVAYAASDSDKQAVNLIRDNLFEGHEDDYYLMEAMLSCGLSEVSTIAQYSTATYGANASSAKTNKGISEPLADLSSNGASETAAYDDKRVSTNKQSLSGKYEVVETTKNSQTIETGSNKAVKTDFIVTPNGSVLPTDRDYNLVSTTIPTDQGGEYLQIHNSHEHNNLSNPHAHKPEVFVDPDSGKSNSNRIAYEADATIIDEADCKLRNGELRIRNNRKDKGGT